MASILTTVGRNKLASATPEQQLTISHIAVGDGNGDFPPLNPSMTSLVNEVWRGAASQPIRTADLGTLIFEGFIPGNIGGFFIREIAIFDNTGAMIAIGQTSVVEKPDPSSGSVVTIAPRLHVKLDNADQVDLIVQDVPYIDHAGLSNRSAAGSHPATAISVDALPAIGLNNPTTVQAALSALKSAATKESQSEKTDATAGKLMLTGAFGLGGLASPHSNWNNINVSGFYTNSTSNQVELPTTALPLSLIHIQSGTNATQICGRTASDEPQMWRRSKENGTWGAWVEFADQRYRFISDANLAVKSGLYSLPLSAGALNAPISNASGTLLVIQGGSGENFVSQMWTQSNDLTAERVFVRHKTSSGWTSWVEVYHTGNKPTANDVGAVPTYAINLPFGKIFVCLGRIGKTDNNACLIISGTGDFGARSRDIINVVIASRADAVLVDANRFKRRVTHDLDAKLYTKDTGTHFELWLETAYFQHTINYSLLSNTGWFDLRNGISDTRPTGLTEHVINTIYTTSNKPTANDVISGTFYGNYTFDVAEGTGIRFGATVHKAIVGSSSAFGEYLFGGSHTGSATPSHYIRIGDNKLQYTTGSSTYDIYHSGNFPAATQAEAEGVSAALRAWSPLRVRQAIEAWARTVNDEVGVVKCFISTVTPAGRYIKANGAAVSRTAYADLFAKIGTFWGAGDGSTTFNVPDLRGEFIRIWDDGRGIDAGRAFGSQQDSENKAHTHTAEGTRTNIGYLASGPGRDFSNTTVTTSASGGGESRPRNVALIAWIRY